MELYPSWVAKKSFLSNQNLKSNQGSPKLRCKMQHIDKFQPNLLVRFSSILHWTGSCWTSSRKIKSLQWWHECHNENWFFAEKVLQSSYLSFLYCGIKLHPQLLSFRYLHGERFLFFRIWLFNPLSVSLMNRHVETGDQWCWSRNENNATIVAKCICCLVDSHWEKTKRRNSTATSSSSCSIQLSKTWRSRFQWENSIYWRVFGNLQCLIT